MVWPPVNCMECVDDDAARYDGVGALRREPLHAARLEVQAQAILVYISSKRRRGMM